MRVAGPVCEFDRVDDGVLLEIIKRLPQVEQVAGAACISRRWNDLLKQVGDRAGTSEGGDIHHVAHPSCGTTHHIGRFEGPRSF